MELELQVAAVEFQRSLGKGLTVRSCCGGGSGREFLGTVISAGTHFGSCDNRTWAGTHLASGDATTPVLAILVTKLAIFWDEAIFNKYSSRWLDIITIGSSDASILYTSLYDCLVGLMRFLKIFSDSRWGWVWCVPPQGSRWSVCEVAGRFPLSSSQPPASRRWHRLTSVQLPLFYWHSVASLKKCYQAV